MNPNNKKRAKRAVVALKAYLDDASFHDEPVGRIVAHLLADLHHLCDEEDIDFVAINERADSHYDMETEEDETVSGMDIFRSHLPWLDNKEEQA